MKHIYKNQKLAKILLFGGLGGILLSFVTSLGTTLSLFGSANDCLARTNCNVSFDIQQIIIDTGLVLMALSALAVASGIALVVLDYMDKRQPPKI